MTGEKSTILLIDDDSRNIFALSAVLRAKGYAVVTAASAAEGISLLHNKKGIKVVLLDMMMPGMDGYEALALLKTDDALARYPVVAVTAQAMVGDRERCLQAGADDYLAKPIDVDRLLALLKAYETNANDEG